MLFKREGMPEESEIVICTVSKIYHHSVFVNMDEYNNISGMLHISEVSPGRIRNLRDYVQEGKKIICKILKINKERGHIDLSLRRVNDNQRRKKLEEIKQEQKCEKIIELVAKNSKLDFKKTYGELKQKIFPKYQNLSNCFEEVALSGLTLESVGIDKKLSKQLEEIIKQRIKPPEVQIGGIMTIICYEQNGVEIIKEILSKHEKNIDINYMGAGKYKFHVIAPDYKDAEKKLNSSVESILDELKKQKGEGQFERIEIK